MSHALAAGRAADGTGWGGFRYGVALQDAPEGPSGRELLQRIVDGALPHPPICRTLTFRLVAVGEGFAAFVGGTGPHQLNPMGGVHGGCAPTLIDGTRGCAAMSVLPAGTAWTNVETKGNLSRPIRAETGRVRCEARVVAQGRQMTSCTAEMEGPDGQVLAHGSSTLLVTAPR